MNINSIKTKTRPNFGMSVKISPSVKKLGKEQIEDLSKCLKLPEIELIAKQNDLFIKSTTIIDSQSKLLTISMMPHHKSGSNSITKIFDSFNKLIKEEHVEDPDVRSIKDTIVEMNHQLERSKKNHALSGKTEIKNSMKELKNTAKNINKRTKKPTLTE